MIFLTAGHHKKDPGASYNGRKEANETVILRNTISEKLRERGIEVWNDVDEWTLAQTVTAITKRAKSADIICDLHFNAGPISATGTEVIVADKYSAEEKNLAISLAELISKVLGIRNRGIKTESQTPRKKLAMLRPVGIKLIVEVCFISNSNDMKLYDKHLQELASTMAALLAKHMTSQQN